MWDIWACGRKKRRHEGVEEKKTRNKKHFEILQNVMELVNNLKSCKTKAEQFGVTTSLACKFEY